MRDVSLLLIVCGIATAILVSAILGMCMIAAGSILLVGSATGRR